ncbi:hypothetical protein KY289_027276 [Solanum tuberosum]|nr:hypothetical protein KY289_027276 [Solanum tuberosum]
MGGLDKTTIAQKVYDDRQLNLNADDSGTDKGDLLNRILEALSHTSCLIVLDDVWSIDDGWWDRISKGLPKFVESWMDGTYRIKNSSTKIARC